MTATAASRGPKVTMLPHRALSSGVRALVVGVAGVVALGGAAVRAEPTAPAAVQLAPACAASTADPSSPRAATLFAHLPRAPQAKAKLLFKCKSDAVAVYVMTYAHASDAPEEAHVLATYLWQPSGPPSGPPPAHPDQVFVANATVVVVSPPSDEASAALVKQGFAPYVAAVATPGAGRTTEQLIAVFRGTDFDAMDGALAELAKQGAPAVPALTTALADPAAMVRSQCAAALGKIGKPAAAAVDALAKLLVDADPDNRWNAANALGQIGSAARAAVPALEKLEADKNPQVAQAAREARARIDVK